MSKNMRHLPLAGGPEEIREDVIRQVLEYAGGKGITKKQLQAVAEGLLPFLMPAILAAAENAALLVLTAQRQTAKDAYKDTERRLYALPTLRRSLEYKGRELILIRSGDVPGKSNSITRFQKNGVRLEKDDIIDALAQNLVSEIARIEYEVDTMEQALEEIRDDKYYIAVYGKYVEGLTDEAIAETIPCDPSTLRRHRGQLVRKLSIWLYGVAAV